MFRSERAETRLRKLCLELLAVLLAVARQSKLELGCAIKISSGRSSTSSGDSEVTAAAGNFR
jgi:hypothetical protein